MGFSGGSVVKNLPANAGDEGTIPESGRSTGEGNSNPLQYSCLGDPMDRGAWQVTVLLLFHCSSCLTLCNPMDCSTRGFPVLHYLLEFAQTYIHWVDDAIQPFHSLLPPSPALSLSQHQGLFLWVSSSYQVAKALMLQLQYQSFWWIFRGVVVAHCFNLHFLNDMMWSTS